MPAPMRLITGRSRPRWWPLLVLALALGVAACQPQRDPADTANTPPVGHYEGSIGAPGQPAVRAALDIRHPSPGHYEAELSVPTAATLSFVADTVGFRNNQLRLTRPARPGQILNLKLDGDFWRGSLALDSTQAPALLVKRGGPTPSTYRVVAVPRARGGGWLFAPSDTGTLGPALALLPDAETAPAAALWADALAREGVIVLVLPAPTTEPATATADASLLRAAVALLRGTAGADTANVGTWASGAQAAALVEVLAGTNAPRVAFVIAQNAPISSSSRAALRELKRRKVPLLGLYSGATATQRAAVLRTAMGSRRGATVRTYRTAGADLLVPTEQGPRFAPGLPGEVVEWLRGQ